MSMQITSQRCFEDVSIGDEYEEQHHPTSERVAEFMGAMNDAREGRFSDASAARAQGLHAAIVPGTMSTAMVYRTVNNWMGPLGRVDSLDITFRRPVLHGDILRAVAVVTDTTDEAEVEAGALPLVTLDITLESTQSGEKPVQGTAVIELPRR